MDAFVVLLLLAALVLFGLAAFGVGAGRVDLIAAGLFCLTLAVALPTLRLAF